MDLSQKQIAYYHLPGLFEFYELYSVFLPLFRAHREYFYDWCRIGSVYGAPADCLWGGGRTSYGEQDPRAVLALMQEYGISARLTFSNSLLKEEHLKDHRCNALCRLFAEDNVMEKYNVQKNDRIENRNVRNGIIIYSDLLLHYLQKQYPGFYFVSSTTKVLTDFKELLQEVNREEFRYVVPDFRLNKQFDKWNTLTVDQKDKIEFLCNECCRFGCKDRKSCYETVSRKILGKPFLIIRALHRMRRKAIDFQKQWKIRDLSVLMISNLFICRWDSLISRSRGADLAVPCCWNSCYTI